MPHRRVMCGKAFKEHDYCQMTCWDGVKGRLAPGLGDQDTFIDLLSNADVESCARDHLQGGHHIDLVGRHHRGNYHPYEVHQEKAAENNSCWAQVLGRLEGPIHIHNE